LYEEATLRGVMETLSAVSLKMRYMLPLLAVLLAGCSVKPASTVDKLAECAARRDIRAAYLLFDKPKVDADLIRQAIDEVHGSTLSSSDAEQTVKRADQIVKDRVWNAIEAEVGKGKNGSLATLSILKTRMDVTDHASVLVQFRSGKETTLQLSMINNKWLITGLDLGMFKKIDATPTLAPEKIKLLKELVGERADQKIYALIGPELRKLLGDEYRVLLTNLSVAGQVRQNGRYIILDGNAPLSGGSEEAIVAVDVDTGILSADVLTGGKVSRFSDIKSAEDYPDLIKSWNKE
jgi:hypothetical protein